MAKRNKSTGSKAGAQTEQPLSKINPSLERLGVLAGDWDVEVSNISSHPDPSVVMHGRSSFEWLGAGTFMLQRSEPPAPEFPRATTIIGPDDDTGTYCALYYDSRGVSRIYQMRLTDNTWTLWRDFPSFSQRFSGMISKDGNTIKARWEKSSDGSTWEHDFDLTYTRVK